MNSLAPARRALFGTPVRHALVLFVAFLAILLSGAVFLPVASGADEAAHYVYAAASVRGQAGTLEPLLPARIANIHNFATCIAFQPDVTAACQGFLQTTDTAVVRTQTNAGLYNPVFYVWTGLGTLLVPTEYGLYISRALAASVTALLLAWAVSFSVRRARTSLPAVGVALILTPMTLYVGMVLNPSAWEIASLYGVTVAAAALLSDAHPRGSWREHHSLLLVAGAILVVTRGLSPLFLCLTAAALLLGYGWRRSWRALLSPPSVWIVLVLFLVTLASVLWVLLHGTHYVGVERPATLWDGLEGISVFYSNYYEQITQMYGTLGWLDLRSPQILASLWVFLLGALVTVCFGIATARERLSLLLAFASATVLPGALAGLQWSGYGWQGRYSLPLVAALLALSAVFADSRLSAHPTTTADPSARIVDVLRALTIGFFIMGAFAVALRALHRYSVGESAPWLTAPAWTPPLPVPFLGAVFVAGVVLVAIGLVSRPPKLRSTSVASG